MSEVCFKEKKDERKDEFDSDYRAIHVLRHHSDELKSGAEMKFRPKIVQKTSLLDISKWLQRRSSKKTI